MENFSCGDFTEWYNLADHVLSYTTALIVVSGISIVPSAVLNIAILITIVRTRSLHTPQNIFMSNLAISNIGLSCLGIPLTITWKVLEMQNQGNPLICCFTFLSYIVSGIFCGVALVTIGAASVDRYLALRLHLTYVTVVTNIKAIIACMVLWVASTIISLLLLVGLMEYCVATAMSIFTIMLVKAFCKVQIFSILRRHHNQIQSQITSHPHPSITNISRFRKSVLTLAYVFAIYIVFYTPYLCSLLMIVFQGVSISSLNLWSVGVLLLCVNSFINPLFHCLKMEEIRTAIRKIILRQTIQTEN